MHKITKGLKKKKKGKKSKSKEEELFKPEELEAYRREHQQSSEAYEITNSTASIDIEEWKKFNALTAGIDTILKKTQGDLDRIKSTSFFQRVPTPSEIKKKEKEVTANQLVLTDNRKEEKSVLTAAAVIVPVSDSESDYEDEDIFDTTYIDAIASGEVKLAYIPESPKEEQEGSDPFDTSIAERAILGPNISKKGKKLVPIGSAVEILTGRVQAPTCVSNKKSSTRRQIQKEKDLLLQSFDDNTNNIGGIIRVATNQEYQEGERINNTVNVVEEFDKNKLQDTEDDEFDLLAVESLKKSIVNTVPLFDKKSVALEVFDRSWNPFNEKELYAQKVEVEKKNVIEVNDPFDTTFAENILPGKAELKIIENEILNVVDERFVLHTENVATRDIIQKVNIEVIDSTENQESVETVGKVSELELNVILPRHRDLLGGSSTDLSKLGDQPLQPKEAENKDYIEYCDPFDTSIVEIAKLPGQTELKFLERELLGELKKSLSDDNFNPRVEESSEKQQTRKVSFDLPLGQHQKLLEGTIKFSKPLTPFYIREDSISEREEIIDPFDTSFVAEVIPAKSELELIENLNSFLNYDINSREQVANTVGNDCGSVKSLDLPISHNTVDLLIADNNVETKVLTPITDKPRFENYTDPFDTSIASNILPGKTELKLLESELISLQGGVSSSSDFRTNILESQVNKILFEGKDNTSVNIKPLISTLEHKLDTELNVIDATNPFDTGVASNID